MKKIICFSTQFFLFTLICSSESYSYPFEELKVPLRDIEKMIDLANRGDVSAAEELAHSTDGVNSKRIEDNTLHRISSLLNSPSGPVRMWAAAAIGNFGSRANEYSPRLQYIVSHDACNMTGLSAADTASAALQKIGITPVPFGCLNRHDYRRHS